MNRLIPMGLAVAALAVASPLDRLMSEDGTDGTVAAGATDGGRPLLIGQASARLRPADCVDAVCIRAAPDAGDEGMLLSDIAAWWVEVCAPGGQILVPNGAECEFWRRNPYTNEWAEVSGAGLEVLATGHCQGSRVVLNGMAVNGVRGLYRCNGIGLDSDAGGSLVVTMAACRSENFGGCAR